MAAEERKVSSIIHAKTIAVVGLSPDEGKPSGDVARYLASQGKEIVPVNPDCKKIPALGLKCYPSLLSIPAEIAPRVEIVDVFRKPEDVPQVAKDAIALRRRNANGRPLIFWMQLGIRNDAAAAALEKAGFAVVQDRCAKTEHARLTGRSAP